MPYLGCDLVLMFYAELLLRWHGDRASKSTPKGFGVGVEGLMR
jgi:hypothetical protein